MRDYLISSWIWIAVITIISMLITCDVCQNKSIYSMLHQNILYFDLFPFYKFQPVISQSKKTPRIRTDWFPNAWHSPATLCNSMCFLHFNFPHKLVFIELLLRKISWSETVSRSNVISSPFAGGFTPFHGYSFR